MTEREQIKAAKEFVRYWDSEERGYEKGESQKFWIDLLQSVFGVENATHYINFENQVHIDKKTGFIDAYIDSTKVMIEQKSRGKSLTEAILQSDGQRLTPFQQARRYIVDLPVDKHPRWVITCNFSEFLIYDMNKPNSEPLQVLLKNLPKEYHCLKILVNQKSQRLAKEEQISLDAGRLVGKLYDALIKQYKNPEDEETQKSLNVLCVRLVFCLYAEDAGIFGTHEMFGEYLRQFQQKDVRKALIELFRVLDTAPPQRDPYMDDDLAAFPYVNGGLFKGDIEIPRFTDEIVDILVNKASAGFDWSEISPTIFGAVFESTLNQETRRSGGMHYTSVENILKVIKPLFLNDLRREFDEIKEIKVEKTRNARLEAFRDKLASLTFFDPACGSGNFLTQTYLELRHLENKALQELVNRSKGNVEGQMLLGNDVTPIKVSIQQFYGIEINDFAVSVAKTALWIAESQMLRETEEIMQTAIPFLPLETYENIHEGNALRMDWESVVPKDRLSYIMGNPPFVGGMWMNKEQKADMHDVFKGDASCVGELDYVSAWYKKASVYIMNSHIKCSFVSTNSITQGQQAVTLWKPLIEQGLKLYFAYRTFQWDSEANLKAHVHCVILGFSYDDIAEKFIFDNDSIIKANHINSYLLDADDIFVESKSEPIHDVPPMKFGNMPRDGKGFILDEKDRADLIKKYPESEKWIKLYLGSRELINNKKRWCLWLVDASPSELRRCPEILNRIEKVRQFRLSSKAASTRKFAETPTLFCQIALSIPEVSSQRRKYIPMGFLDKDVIASNKLFIVANASLYHFGVLESNVHMAWMRAVAGRLKSDYSYSKDIVYNTFPWCNPTEKQKALIEKTAQAILDARALYPDCSLADLYDELTMPPELRKAHQMNDRAVMEAYGFWGKLNTESECVAELMKMYQRLIEV